MSQRSTAAAHERPSAMAQTMRLCPRRLIAADEDTLDVGGPVRIRGHRAPRSDLDPELVRLRCAVPSR